MRSQKLEVGPVNALLCLFAAVIATASACQSAEPPRQYQLTGQVLAINAERQELTVSELCTVLQLPQSTVSRHLRQLADAEWVSSRRDGTSRYYALSLDASGPRSQIWELTRPQVASRPGTEQDARRLARVLSGRREASVRFFATSAGQWDHLRDELFGQTFLPGALLGLIPSVVFGGSMTLACPSDGGTVVTMTLPIRPAPSPPGGGAASSAHAQDRPESART